MTFADGCKESMYLTWKSERYKVTPAFESLSFYDNRDGNVSCYCISLTRDWYEKKNYPRWDDCVAIDGDLSEEVVEQWISCYESQAVVFSTATAVSNTSAGTPLAFPYWINSFIR